VVLGVKDDDLVSILLEGKGIGKQMMREVSEMVRHRGKGSNSRA
jgi:hypothetical protein